MVSDITYAKVTPQFWNVTFDDLSVKGRPVNLSYKQAFFGTGTSNVFGGDVPTVQKIYAAISPKIRLMTRLAHSGCRVPKSRRSWKRTLTLRSVERNSLSRRPNCPSTNIQACRECARRSGMLIRITSTEALSSLALACSNTTPRSGTLATRGLGWRTQTSLLLMSQVFERFGP